MFSCLFSLNDVVVPEEGVMAFVNISKDGFFSYSYERMIFSYAIEEFDWQVLTSLLGSIGFIHNQLNVQCFGVFIYLHNIKSIPKHISQGSSHRTLAFSRWERDANCSELGNISGSGHLCFADGQVSWNKFHPFSVEELTFKRRNSPKKKHYINVVQ